MEVNELRNFIKMIETFKSFAEIKALKNHSNFLAQGSSRMVFKFDNKVIKVAKNILGLVQNSEEFRLRNCDNLLLEILEYSNNDLYVIMPFAEATKPKKINGIERSQWDLYARNTAQDIERERSYFYIDKIEEIKAEENSKLRDSIYNLLNCDLLAGDLFKKDSLAMYKGCLVLVDYGFTKNTLEFRNKKIKTPKTIREAYAIVERFYNN